MREPQQNPEAEFLARAREAARVLPALSDQIEAERRLVPAAVEALAKAGVFKMLVPRALGGAEVSIPTMIAALEEVARRDGAAGWCAMIAATSGLMSAFLEEPMAREVFGRPDAVTAGVFAPMGGALEVAGGYQVSGRWPFCSGCQHAQWRMGGAVLMNQDGPLLSPTGVPRIRSMLFKASETTVLDTWTVSGLRGTGSHDIEASDVFVPAERSFSLISDAPRYDRPLYRMPPFGVLAAGIAAVALGIARASTEALIELATTKQPLGAKRSIAHRELLQHQVAQAEAKLRAGRALLLESTGEVAEEVAARGAASIPARARWRLASCHAVTESAAAVDLMYQAAGGTAIYASSPLQRHFRDIHTATQHVMVGPAPFTLAGRLLLGLESDVTTL